MKRKFKIFAILLSIPLFVLLVFRIQPTSAQTNAQTVETAGQHYKNIKVLNDMPADQLGKVMNMMSASLGVNCAFCHKEDDFAADGKREKDTARNMIKMTFAINKDNFRGRAEVTCNTCHHGDEHPQSTPSLEPIRAEERPLQPTTKPTGDDIAAKYIAALGGSDKLAAIKTRSVTATRVEADGKTTEPETLYFGAGKYYLKTTYGTTELVDMYDGTSAHRFGNVKFYYSMKADEGEQIKREAELFAPQNIKQVYTKLDYRAVDRINGREVYVVFGTTASNARERLYFDTKTGLLVRRVASTPTVLGTFVYQVDYLDYKKSNGVLLPMTIKYSMPNLSWTRKITSVKNNVSLDDKLFVVPAS